MEMQVDIKRVQNRLFQMGQVIANILSTHNIPHMITFGTLLGAVRHGGFIPWDDDFDFFLFDDTYDEAIEILRKELPSDMFLEDEKSEPKYFHGWAHVKDLNSEVYCEQFPQDNLYEHHGLSVDLYRCKKINSSDIVDYRINELKKYLNRKLEKGIINQEQFDSNLIKIYQQIEREEHDKPIAKNSTVFAMAVKERYVEEADVFPLKLYNFDGVSFWGPNNADKILKHFYGDYMRLPDEKDRIPHYSKVEFIDNSIQIEKFKNTKIKLKEIEDFVINNDYLFPDSFANNISIPEYIKKLYKYAEIIVAIEHGIVCGLACAYMNDEIGKIAHLQLLLVDKNHQKMGLGRMLCEKVLDYSRLCGMEKIVLTVDIGNVPAEELYKSIGFVESLEKHEKPNKRYLECKLGTI